MRDEDRLVSPGENFVAEAGRTCGRPGAPDVGNTPKVADVFSAIEQLLARAA